MSTLKLIRKEPQPGINVFLLGGHVLFRDILFQSLEQQHMIEVVGHSSGEIELFRCSDNTKINVLVLNFDIGIDLSVQFIDHIKARHSGVKIVALSQYSSFNVVNKVKEFGVNGFVSIRDNFFCDLVSIIQSVHYTTEELFETKGNYNNVSGFEFTKREIEVLELIGLGLTSKKIGQKLFLSPRTVDGIRKSLLQKTNCVNVAGLMAYAIKNGIIYI
jgi:DNA-binding NarL/FixJ family response regulator